MPMIIDMGHHVLLSCFEVPFTLMACSSAFLDNLSSPFAMFVMTDEVLPDFSRAFKPAFLFDAAAASSPKATS